MRRAQLVYGRKSNDCSPGSLNYCRAVLFPDNGKYEQKCSRDVNLKCELNSFNDFSNAVLCQQNITVMYNWGYSGAAKCEFETFKERIIC